MSNQIKDDQKAFDETSVNDDSSTTDETSNPTETPSATDDSAETTDEIAVNEKTPVDDTHREAVGAAVAQAQSQGLDMGQLSQQLGLSTDDVNAMTHGDLMSVAKHLASEHPEIAQNLLGRIPVIGGLLGSLFGGNK